MEVQGYPDLTVVQPLTGDLRMNAICQHVGGVGMPQKPKLRCASL